jgi:hypothetical protein
VRAAFALRRCHQRSTRSALPRHTAALRSHAELLPPRPSAPVLPDRPLTHSAPQADNVPHARARRARDATEDLGSKRSGASFKSIFGFRSHC